MYRILLHLLVLISVPCMAQITVTQSNFPRAASFTDTILSTTQPGIALPNEGANQIWDYSTLGVDNTNFRTHTDATTDPVFTNALNSFNTNISFQSFTIPVTVYEAIDVDGWFIEGQAISEISYPLDAITGNTADSLIFPAGNDLFNGRVNPVKFPCTFQTQWTGLQEERLDLQLTLASAGLSQAPGYKTTVRTENSTVVGYGKLLIPSFTGGPTDTMEVLQIKVISEAQDSFYLMGTLAPDSVLSTLGLSQGSVVRDTSYTFFRADYAGIVLDLNLIGNSVASATYRPQAANVLSTGLWEERTTTLQYYPNPISTGGNLTIAMPSGGSRSHQVMLVDLFGKQIFGATVSEQLDRYSFNLPPNTLAGMYVVKVSDDTGRLINTSKLLVR